MCCGVVVVFICYVVCYCSIWYLWSFGGIVLYDDVVCVLYGCCCLVYCIDARCRVWVLCGDGGWYIMCYGVGSMCDVHYKGMCLVMCCWLIWYDVGVC